MSQHEYTIDIPGLSDIFILPFESFDNKELRKERIQRFKTHRSPIPQSIKWIPDAITYLDDVQDMLIVGLTLAKPLLRKLPARFIPALGWVLLFNDFLNLSTAILGTATGGRIPKRDAEIAFKDLRATSTGKLNNVPDFLNNTNWLGFALQAGQVAENLTGYGLRLGPVMGMMSDAFWGTIRALQGKRVTIRGPLPDDPIWKAASLLTQTHKQIYLDDVLTLEEHEKIIAAENIATQILRQGISKDIDETRANDLFGTWDPVHAPWNQASVVALKEMGISDLSHIHSVSDGEIFGPFMQGPIEETSKRIPDFEANLKAKYGKSDRGQIMQLVFKDGGETAWDIIGNSQRNITPIRFGYQDAFLRAIERNVFPPPNTFPIRQYLWGTRSLEIAAAEGRRWPNKDDLEKAAIEKMGGFVRR